jgi:acetolactate decarboxylase
MRNILIAVLLFSVAACQKAPKLNERQSQKIPTMAKDTSSDLEMRELIRKHPLKVLDTDFSKGRLRKEHCITLNDLEKFHGHLCDGLVVGFLAIGQAAHLLYPDGPIDRTNTRIVSKSSPCLTDAAVYLTGARYQFHTFYVDNKLPDAMYIVQRIDNGKAVGVKLKKGVKPKEIEEMGARAVKQELGPCELDTLKEMEDDFSLFLLRSRPDSLFEMRELPAFKWQPFLRNDFVKSDILNKNMGPCAAH